MAVVACFDLVVGTQVGFLSLLSLGPALAPVSLGPVRTMLTGGVAVVLSFLLAAVGGIAFSAHAIESCATIAGVTVAAVIASAARQRKESTCGRSRMWPSASSCTRCRARSASSR
jgi:uncharacterized membrane protein YccC